MLIYRLPDKAADEEIIRVLRKDLFIFFKKVIFFIILVILPLIFGYLITGVFPFLLYGQAAYPLMILVASIYYLFIWLLFFFFFINFYLNVTIITNIRIININQDGFFSRVIAEQTLDRVQDVTSDVRGLLPTLFRYGDVEVQTAGEKERFNFTEISCPDKVRDLIIKLAEDYKATKKI